MKQPEALESLGNADTDDFTFGDRGRDIAGFALYEIQNVTAEAVWEPTSFYDWCDDLGGINEPPPFNALSYAWEVHDRAEEKLR